MSGVLLADNVQYYCIKPRFPIQPVVTGGGGGVFESPFRESVLSSAFWVTWIIIIIEIKNENRWVIV